MTLLLNIKDVGTKRDPTGTGALRKQFRTDMITRWQKIGVMVSQAIFVHNLFGLGPTSAHSVANPDKVTMFSKWFDSAIHQQILNHNWMMKYVSQATKQAHSNYQAENRTVHFAALAFSELQGIVATAKQKAIREYTDAVASRQTPSKVSRLTIMAFKQPGLQRADMLINFIIVKAYNGAILDDLRQRKYKSVGIIPEHLPHKRFTDAVRKTQQKRHESGRFVSELPEQEAKQRKAERRHSRLKTMGQVYVVTAEDEDVCDECQEIADDGPYDIDSAEGLIPAHPNCRCVFVPASEGAPFEDDFNPDEERDEHGRWTTGGSSNAETADPEIATGTGMDRAQLQAIANRVADDCNFDRAEIEITNSEHIFTLNGQQFKAAGTANTRGVVQINEYTGRPDPSIKLYVNQMAPSYAAGVVRHEIEHMQYQGVLDRREVEFNNLMKEPVSSNKLMNADGTLKPPYDEKYPVLQALSKLSKDVPLLKAADGVSDYSYKWWKEYANGKADLRTAMHETLAEMARIRYETGKFPEHMGERIISWRGSTTAGGKGDDTPRPSQAQVDANAKAWKDLYNTVQKAYSSLPKPPWATPSRKRK